jgi:hypothetical protein
MYNYINVGSDITFFSKTHFEALVKISGPKSLGKFQENTSGNYDQKQGYGPYILRLPAGDLIEYVRLN